MSRSPSRYLPTPWLIPRPPEGLGDSSAIGAGTNWPAANRAIYQPFSLPLTRFLKSMTIVTSASAGTFDIGLYDETCTNLMASLGSTAASTGLITYTLTSPILLEAGVRYYAGLVCSSTTTRPAKWDTPAGNLRLCGLAQEALGSSTLPSTATPAQVATGYHPAIALDFAQ